MRKFYIIVFFGIKPNPFCPILLLSCITTLLPIIEFFKITFEPIIHLFPILTFCSIIVLLPIIQFLPNLTPLPIKTLLPNLTYLNFFLKKFLEINQDNQYQH